VRVWLAGKRSEPRRPALALASLLFFSYHIVRRQAEHESLVLFASSVSGAQLSSRGLHPHERRESSSFLSRARATCKKSRQKTLTYVNMVLYYCWAASRWASELDVRTAETVAGHMRRACTCDAS
jgi:hypothetical protein